jgi:signal transduction histidine kinase
VSAVFASLRGRLAALYVALALVAILGGAIGAAAFSRLLDARDDLVNRVDPAVAAASEIVADLVDQETGVRGYALSGRAVFLDPFIRGTRAQRSDAARLRAAAPGLAGIPPMVDDVLARADRWRTTVAEPTIVRVRGRRSEALGVLEQGKVRFDEFRASANRLRGALTVQRAAARARLDDQTRTLETHALILAATLLVIGAISWLALRRWVVEPLAHLGGAARRVEAGELDRPIEPEGPAEIALLAVRMEDMRARIVRELAEVQRSNDELEQFAYVASHDLQEPLRQVANFCALLERRHGGDLDEQGREFLRFIVDGAERMQRLIEDLLAFSRVGRAPERFAELDLGRTLDDALADLETRRVQAGAEVTSDELPTVFGDRTLLTTLWRNLIGNALKFHRDAPPRVHVSCAPDADGDWELAVRDNGIGVEPQYAEQVFDIFRRLHPAERYEGTGIGLAMCKKIVEFHGGRIAIAPNDDGTPGSTVRFSLPRSPRRSRR